ncbi:hypothetical protein BaRGS_00036668 [Batillaria attramentaria]|uniref:Uncharacterized protein n=1 Tax=Batillaria attramentaria TaxID=370345 RepID=A0ABD0JAT7_9CAEN
MSVCQQQNIHRSAVVPHGVPQIPGPGLLSLDPKQDHQRPIPEPEGTRRRTKKRPYHGTLPAATRKTRAVPLIMNCFRFSLQAVPQPRVWGRT